MEVRVANYDEYIKVCVQENVSNPHAGEEIEECALEQLMDEMERASEGETEVFSMFNSSCEEIFQCEKTGEDECEVSFLYVKKG